MNNPKLAIVLKVFESKVVIEVDTSRAYLPDWDIEKVVNWYCEVYTMPRDKVMFDEQYPLLPFDTMYFAKN